jgi:hypothetical protein
LVSFQGQGNNGLFGGGDMNKTSKRPERRKIAVGANEIEEQFQDQLGFLEKSAKAFDAGESSEYRRMAVALRILLWHRPPNSHSLVQQVGLGNASFESTGIQINSRNLLTDFGLALTNLTDGGARLQPILDDSPIKSRWIALDDWLAEPVLRDNHRHLFTRIDFIRYVADQDGGAHVDPAMDEPYHRLVNENSIGLIEIGPDGLKPVEQIERVYIRQIAYEAATSLEAAWQRKLGNRRCDCGSGRKRRYCCGK